MMSFTVNMKGMKHMKRLMSLLISAAMILSTGASVSATDAEVSSPWKTITISEELAAKKTTASTKEVKVTSVKVSESEITLKKGETLVGPYLERLHTKMSLQWTQIPADRQW